MRALSAKAGELASALDDSALATLGDELERRDPAADGAVVEARPSGFERVANDRDGVLRVSELATAAAERWESQKGTVPARNVRDRTRRVVVAALNRTFERAFGQFLPVARNGPGVRFLQAFFRVHGIRVPGSTAKRWVSDSAEHEGAQAIARMLRQLRALRTVGTQLRHVRESRRAGVRPLKK